MGFIIKYKEENQRTYTLDRKNWIVYLSLLIVSGVIYFYLGVSYKNSSWIIYPSVIFFVIVAWGFVETIPMWWKASAASLQGKQISSKQKGTIFHKNFESEIKIEK